jgi:hypothetical protein
LYWSTADSTVVLEYSRQYSCTGVQQTVQLYWSTAESRWWRRVSTVEMHRSIELLSCWQLQWTGMTQSHTTCTQWTGMTQSHAICTRWTGMTQSHTTCTQWTGMTQSHMTCIQWNNHQSGHQLWFYKLGTHWLHWFFYGFKQSFSCKKRKFSLLQTLRTLWGVRNDY